MDKVTVKDIEVCLYHGYCSDGIASAWAISHFGNENVVFVAVFYEKPFPKREITGKNVAIVDFCYNQKETIEICKLAKNVIILDHHDTAERNISAMNGQIDNLSCIFDKQRSGAQITWDWCCTDADEKERKRPWFIDIIADRDLWKFELPHSKELNKALKVSYNGIFELQHLYESEVPIVELVEMGSMLLELDKQDIKAASENSELRQFEGYKVRIGTISNSSLISEFGHHLCTDYECDFAAVYRWNSYSNEYKISLRASEDCKIALNLLCEKYKGGGHLKACGFSLKEEELDKVFVVVE